MCGLLAWMRRLTRKPDGPIYSALMDEEPRSLDEMLPELVGELVDLLRAEGEDRLASSVPSLNFWAWCSCGDDLCKSFRTAPPPEGPYGTGHRCVSLLPEKGMIILHVVHDEIRFVEILDRDSLG